MAAIQLTVDGLLARLGSALRCRVPGCDLDPSVPAVVTTVIEGLARLRMTK